MPQLLQELATRYLWNLDYRNAPRWQQFLISLARGLILIIRDLLTGELNLRAMSLVYTTLLSIVPLLALSFSILKGFGVQNQLSSSLRLALEPLGAEKATQISENLINFVNNMNVGVLGAVGLGFLLYTVVSLMKKIESAFNYVWRVRASRSFGERFTTFLSAVTIGPLLVFTAIAVTGSAMNTSLMDELRSVAAIGATIDLVAKLVPFALIITAFTFLYVFIPNTRVKLIAALTGGLIAGILWETLSFGFASYAAGASRYHLVYATFATAMLLMIWLYLNWLILLVGASIAFYRQHPEMVTLGMKTVRFSATLTRSYALSLLAEIGRRLYEKQPPYTLESLAEHYQTPSHVLEYCLQQLVDIGILAETDDKPAQLVAGVPYDTTTVAEVLARIDAYLPTNTYSPPSIDDPVVMAIDQAAREGRSHALAGLTLKQLALGEATQEQAPTSC
jgi:membrane protein